MRRAGRAVLRENSRGGHGQRGPVPAERLVTRRLECVCPLDLAVGEPGESSFCGTVGAEGRWRVGWSVGVAVRSRRSGFV